jgi:hypothetical protein
MPLSRLRDNNHAILFGDLFPYYDIGTNFASHRADVKANAKHQGDYVLRPR